MFLYSTACSSFNMTYIIKLTQTGMVVKIMILKILLLGYFIYAQYITAENIKCYDNHFFNGSECLECPSACALCVSETNCTRCIDGFFDDLCKTPCLQNCSGKSCHLKYGHCNNGCPDGQFFSTDQEGCSPCPKHCVLCISMSKCITCQDGYFDDTCSKICPPECGGKTCNQSTGHCFQCKEGYVRQNGKCLQCPQGCAICVNSTYCSECRKTYVGTFLGQCIQKCDFKQTNFSSNLNQICGISLDNMPQNPPSCWNPIFERHNHCKTVKYCIECETYEDACLSIRREDLVCLGYEQCISQCEPPISVNGQHIKDTTALNAQCKQICSVYRMGKDQTKQVCQFTTEDNTKRRYEEIVFIGCFQEPDLQDDSTKEYRTLIIVVVVVVLACVIFILLIGEVAYLLKMRYVKSTGCPGTPEVTQVLQPIQRSTRQDHLISSLHRVPSVESLYDRASCSQFVAGYRMYNTTRNTQHRHNIADEIFHPASGFQCVSDNREFNKSCPTLREKADNIYDTTFHSKFKTNNERMNISAAGTSHMSDVDSDMYDDVLFYQSAPIPTMYTANTDIAETLA